MNKRVCRGHVLRLSGRISRAGWIELECQVCGQVWKWDRPWVYDGQRAGVRAVPSGVSSEV